MNQDDAETLATAIAKAFQQIRSVNDTEHYNHHRWIEAEIKRAEARAKFWDQMIAHVAKCGAISLLTAGGYALWLGLKSILRASL